MKQFIEVWKMASAGGYNLINGAKVLELSAGEPVDYAVWRAAQLAICLEFPLIVEDKITDPTTVKTPKYTFGEAVKTREL